MRKSLLFAVFLLAFNLPVIAADRPHQVAGLVENALVGNPGAKFEAKLDTGADISSIDAIDIVEERRSGRRWVSFTVVRVDGERVKLSGRLVRHVHVKRVGTGGATNRRAVALLEICLGSVSRSVEVSLADREGFDYDLLIGKNFLGGYFMVDPDRDHILKLDCRGGEVK